MPKEHARNSSITLHTHLGTDLIYMYRLKANADMRTIAGLRKSWYASLAKPTLIEYLLFRAA